MKATARAYPVQGLIKHHMLFDNRIRLPFHDLISVCTAPLCTVTTFAFQEEKEVTIKGEPPDFDTISRIDSVVSEIRRLSGVDEEYKIVSENNFPSMGLGASSGFAALAVAAAKAAGLDLSHKELSRIAKKGAGSASESVTGWFSRWRSNIEEQFCYSFVIEDELEMGMVAALVEPFEYMDELRKKVLTSSLFEYRLKTIHTRLYNMERAIKDHDVSKIGRLAEEDTLIVHALTMTGNKEMVWGPDILQVMAEVKALREEGVEAYFSIDTGAVVYMNSYPEDVAVITERINALGVKTIQLSVGGEAHVIREHLF